MTVVKVLGDRLLVRQLVRDTRVGHFYYAPGFTPEQFLHEVVSVGSKVRDEIKPGDRVFLDQYRLTDRTQAGDDLWIVRVEACCLVLS
jgi:co-chaperonin GroES (HSP10)